MAKRITALAAACCIAVGACSTVQTTAPGAVGVERKQRMLISEEEVRAGAEQAYAQQLKEASSKGLLNADKNLTARVQEIAQRLIPHTAAFRPDAPGWKWEVNTMTSKELNAYAMPGGKIMVYSGLVDQLKLSDAEIAAVIGHEIAHALREHSRERISRAYTQQIALTGLAVLTGLGQGAADLANTVATVTFQLPHGRAQESEADVIGMELMARAGYDPNAAVSVWQKMLEANKGGPPEFLSTHPSPTTRIQELQALVPKVKPLYDAAKG